MAGKDDHVAALSRSCRTCAEHPRRSGRFLLAARRRQVPVVRCIQLPATSRCTI